MNGTINGLADLEIGCRCDVVRDYAEQKIMEHYGQLGDFVVWNTTASWGAYV